MITVIGMMILMIGRNIMSKELLIGGLISTCVFFVLIYLFIDNVKIVDNKSNTKSMIDQSLKLHKFSDPETNTFCYIISPENNPAISCVKFKKE